MVMTKIEESHSKLTNKESHHSLKENSKTQDCSDALKKRKRKKRATICTTYCKFEIVRRIARNLGMKEVAYQEPWNILWTDYSVSIAKIKVLKGYQRVNHFPGMAEICHKALLAKNLNRMAKHFPKQYGFFPRTWCFPSEYNDAVEYSKKHVGRTYILKPGAGCRGQGIQLTKNFRCLPPADKLICQLYISKPFLVDGLKFDLRVYTLVTSCEPLRIYVYNEGLARFATAPYRKPAGYNLANCYMHLTNYSVNKYSSTFVSDGECGTKRRISCLNQWLGRNLYDVDDIWFKIDDVIVKTIISALPVIKHSYQVSFPNHNVLQACFEILGFDILLDSNLNPFVLEVNHSPSFNTDSKVDEEIKVALLEDTFKLLNLAEMDTQKILEQDKRRSQMRLQNGVEPQDILVSSWSSDRNWPCEEGHIGNYRLVYPVKGKTPGSKDDPFRQFIEQASSFNLLVTDNATSKAREQVGKIQRDQLTQKDQLEQLLKVHSVKQQQYQIKIPEFTSKSDNKLMRNPKMQKPDQNKIKSEADWKVMEKDRHIKDDEKSEVKFEKENLKLNHLECHIDSIRSEINYVLMAGEEQSKEIPIKERGTDYYAKKLYKRLKESGHMPGAFYPSPDSKKLIKLEDVLSLQTFNGKTPPGKENVRKKKLKDGRLIEISNKVPKSTEFQKKFPTKEFALRFHSRAASEFLKFQKMKLLRKFQDLT